MTMYWERCDFCGQHRPVMKCSTIPDFSVDAHCCVACPLRVNQCKAPVWKLEVAPVQAVSKRRSISSEEKEKLLKELTALLKGE
mgnify:CR=1 FL=1